jgi:hypothetical protein
MHPRPVRRIYRDIKRRFRPELHSDTRGRRDMHTNL